MTSETPQPAGLSLTVSEEGAVRILNLRGSVGMEEVERLEQRLHELAATGNKLILDLTELTFLNSAGLGAIITTYRRCRDEGGALGLVGPREGVAQLLRITHLDRLLSIYPDVQSAHAALTTAGK